jgi:hypothetical protein
VIQVIEQDTIKLLRECDAGVKMGIDSIEDVVEKAEASGLKKHLENCKRDHETLDCEIQDLLKRYDDEGKEPSAVSKGMSWVKTNVMLGFEETDATVADLITDGCNMGVKSLNRYLNQYKAADEFTKDITKRLINLEEKLAVDLRGYL